MEPLRYQLLFELIRRNHGKFTAIGSRFFLVTNLRFDPEMACQSCHTVWAKTLTKTTQIVMDFAVPIHTTTF